MDYVVLVGLSAGILTTTSFLPQLIKAYRTKSTGDISALMFAVVSIGFALWLVYGILIRSLPIILANSVSLTLASIILALKVKYK